MSTFSICLVKPDGMRWVKEIREYVLARGVEIVDEKDHIISENDVTVLYSPVLESQPWAIELIMGSMVSHMVHIMLCEGNEELFKTLFVAKQHIRHMYMKENPKGVLHTSEDEEEARREIQYFFGSNS